MESTLSAATAILLDALAVYAGLMLAQYIRFETGLISLRHEALPLAHQQLLAAYGTGAFITSFALCRLYRRPQFGRFEDKIPRIIKSILYSYIAYFAIETIFRIDPQFSRKALVVSLGTVSFLVLFTKYILYRIEWNLARHMDKINRVAIIGTDALAIRLQHAINDEPFLRSHIAGHISTPEQQETAAVSNEQILGTLDQLNELLLEHNINQVVLADLSLDHEYMVNIIHHCEKNLIRFSLVPDIFRILTSGVVVETINGIPMISLKKWPLDHVFNRARKRAFDIAGALFGLIITSPIIALFAILIKATSPGPIFYGQERLGEAGKPFTIYKLRTMNTDAETGDQPGWTKENDPRRTKLGSFMRAWNIDELPQFWNVLTGEMSLVGPRPERAFFVEQFKEMIDRYMVRHVFKPGITGWAQVNGLRGDTSIEDRIKYDLYYLENWSLSFDFKILLKTFFNHDNAY